MWTLFTLHWVCEAASSQEYQKKLHHCHALRWSWECGLLNWIVVRRQGQKKTLKRSVEAISPAFSLFPSTWRGFQTKHSFIDLRNHSMNLLNICYISLASVEIYWYTIMSSVQKSLSQWLWSHSDHWFSSQVISCIQGSCWKNPQVGGVWVSESISSWAEHCIFSFSTVLEMLLSFWFCNSLWLCETASCTIQVNFYWVLDFSLAFLSLKSIRNCH